MRCRPKTLGRSPKKSGPAGNCAGRADMSDSPLLPAVGVSLLSHDHARIGDAPQFYRR